MVSLCAVGLELRGRIGAAGIRCDRDVSRRTSERGAVSVRDSARFTKHGSSSMPVRFISPPRRD